MQLTQYMSAAMLRITRKIELIYLPKKNTILKHTRLQDKNHDKYLLAKDP
jgi:hypothetical protein